MNPESKSGSDFDVRIQHPNENPLALRAKNGVRYTIRLWDRIKRFEQAVWEDPANLINELVVDNLTTLQGLQAIQTCYLAGAGGPIPAYGGAWFQPLFVGLINATGFVAVNYVDTAQKITTSAPSFPTTNNWQELTTYSGGVRQAMGALNIVAGSNATVASTFGTPPTFVASGSGNIQGAFLIAGPSGAGGGNTQGPNSAGIVLISEAAAPGAPLAFTTGQTITVSLTITETSA